MKEHFDLKAWIYVATQFLLLEVTKSFLTAIGCRHTKDDSLDLLQRQPKESLVNKNFLLVLDDVWDVESFDWESWGSLRTPLRGAAQGSKILVTSRDESVAKTMRAVCTHPLGELNPPHCGSLFERLHFKIDSNARLELEPVGRQIVDKCQGLPMAVKAVGHILYSKVEKGDWVDVLNSQIWRLDNGSGILPSLRLSYHHLFLPLKHCFAYCSIFPQAHKFDKEELILLWMAEGLLHPRKSDGRRMEEIDESYFDEPLAKSFFQKFIREEESCILMHDLIYMH